MGLKNTNYSVQFFATLVLLFSSIIAVAKDAAPVDDYQQFKQAVTLSQQGSWQQAAEIFAAIAERNPSWPEPKNNLAVSQLNMGQVEQAKHALESAVTSLPSFKTAQDNRQRLYDHLAAVAYSKALGIEEKQKLPALDLLTEIKLAEKPKPEQLVVEKIVEVPVTAIASDDSDVDHVNKIRQGLLSWSSAWSQADTDNYLSAYSTRFQPSDQRKDYTQWRNIRRARLKSSSSTQVELENIKVYLDTDNSQALTEFIQHYKSASYQDKVLKQMHLALENGQWLILSERVIQQLD